MKLAFTVVDWQASAPGLAEPQAWQAWAVGDGAIDATAMLAKSRYLPMMTARRLASGSRQAVECGLALMARQSVDAVVFASRHGELERNYRILSALAQQQPLSPTDFAMSVHNAAVGSLTIAAKAPLVSSSVCAGADTFQQALLEVATLHHAGYRQVLLVDFDGAIPEFYQSSVSEPYFPWAVGLVLASGGGLCCQSEPRDQTPPGTLPQGLAFLRAWLGGERAFCLAGERLAWRWSVTS
jgi:hypothetical protein